MATKNESKTKREEAPRLPKDHSKVSTKVAQVEYQVGMDLQKQIEFYEECLQEVFERKRDFFIEVLTERISSSGVIAREKREVSVANESWIEIESLSKLRAVVGGRFQNIKQKWIDAGLPLREHRGDRAESFSIIKEGWLELSHWINNQGFEVRLSNGKESCLFEIRTRK